MPSADYIPFVASQGDAKTASRLYADARCYRVPLHSVAKLKPGLPPHASLWVDPSFDGYPAFQSDSDWAKYLSQFGGHKYLADPNFLAKPDPKVIREYVGSVLNAAMAFKPTWVTVPQLAHADDVSRNRVNKVLAGAFRSWADQKSFSGVAILPAVFTNQRQLTNKVPRDKKVAAIRANFDLSGATGVWAVDASLRDQTGTANFEAERFPGIIALHSCLATIPKLTVHIAGPYWGLNLVLWARGLVSNPAIALGNGYRYFVAGLNPKKGRLRVAMPPLRRWVLDTAELKAWLSSAVSAIAPSQPAHSELVALQRELGKLALDPDAHRAQIARAYRDWYAFIAKVPPAGRGLAMYQDLSNAYALGQTLPDFQMEEGNARHPSTVARQLMLSCLGPP